MPTWAKNLTSVGRLPPQFYGDFIRLPTCFFVGVALRRIIVV